MDDDDAAGDEERWVPGGPDGRAVPGTGPAVAGPEAAALAAEAEEIRRLVDAGAGSPDELRALAERLRAHRAREEALWRAQVKPTLKAKRGAVIGGPPSTPMVDPATSHSSRQSLTLGLGLLALVVLVVLLAASSSVLWVLLPVVGVLAAAWWQGKQAR
jgi:hypothetical protein